MRATWEANRQPVAGKISLKQDTIKIYVDNDNIPHVEIDEPGGKKKVYELNLKDKK